MDIIERILEEKLGDIVTDTQLKILFHEMSDNQRYGVVKRALANGRLIRIRRGLYCLNERYRKKALNLFELAEKVYGPSYISFESALAYHGWIPEAVYTVSSACIKQSRTFDTPVGVFSYSKVPPDDFFLNVERVSDSSGVFFMATPGKALLDLIAVRKKTWDNISQLSDDLRIEKDNLLKVPPEEWQKMSTRFGNKSTQNFINQLEKEFRG